MKPKTMNELLSPAEQNILQTTELCKGIKKNFLEIGRLLYENFVNMYWQVQWDSFSDYLESLGAGSRSQLSRLMHISMCVATRVFREGDVLEMGVSCAELLLPVVRRGELTQDLIEVAKSGSTRELRRALGHRINENDHNYSIMCPRCGETITGCKWVRKDA